MEVGTPNVVSVSCVGAIGILCLFGGDVVVTAAIFLEDAEASLAVAQDGRPALLGEACSRLEAGVDSVSSAGSSAVASSTIASSANVVSGSG